MWYFTISVLPSGEYSNEIKVDFLIIFYLLAENMMYNIIHHGWQNPRTLKK